MAYRNNPNFGRKHTDGRGNVTFIPYADNTTGGLQGTPVAARDPFENPAGPPQAVDVQPLQSQQIAEPTLPSYDAFLRGMDTSSSGHDPLYDPNMMGGNRVSRGMLQESGLPSIILNTPNELAKAQKLSELDSKWTGRNIRAAQDMINKGRSDLANEFLFNVDELNQKRGTSHESRMQYYLKKLRDGVAPKENSSNGYSA